ncbi:MAG: hypothetical protein ACYCX6_00890 [Vulcanimicrobiaceae bacterium]
MARAIDRVGVRPAEVVSELIEVTDDFIDARLLVRAQVAIESLKLVSAFYLMATPEV